MLPVKTAAFARPDEATRPAAMLLVYGFTSTSVKRQSGRSDARRRERWPQPAPNSTMREPGSRRGSTCDATLRSCCRLRSVRSAPSSQAV